MSNHDRIKEIICSQSELRLFAQTDQQATAQSLHDFVSSKSKHKYAVVEQAFIKELLGNLDELGHITSEQRSKLHKNWAKLIGSLKYEQATATTDVVDSLRDKTEDIELNNGIGGNYRASWLEVGMLLLFIAILIGSTIIFGPK